MSLGWKEEVLDWGERGTFWGGPPGIIELASEGCLKMLVLVWSHAANLSVVASASFKISLISTSLNRQ